MWLLSQEAHGRARIGREPFRGMLHYDSWGLLVHMNLTSHYLGRALPAVGALAVAGALLAGCGSGANTAMPTTVAPQHPTQVHSTTHVSKAAIPSVMAKLLYASAFYSPMKGQHIRPIPGVHQTMTAVAGNNLTFNGGPVQTGSNEYNILVNCNDESCWGGMISTFQNDLFGSSMMGLLPQYNAGGTYAFAGDYPATYTISGTLQDQDIYNILYSVITTNNLPTGYGSEFHVFLGSGVQQCSQAAGGCYAQQYCAYHGSNDWSDIGHVLYSVEPYQDIPGCQVSTLPSPNGSLQDSTASTLSHETFETITDPDVAANSIAWYNSTYGEIGDLCAPANGVPTGNVTLGVDTWEIQMEYDNNISDCSYTL